ncbi:MAG: sec-independent protein translocase protein TatB [Porticoccaceae bacterium]|jgi:sec-independent protein translocase protein TatB|tara:strand:+ start:582 stop:881 length:300 start_codon:yes stop_codon:yes gene_type:complete
MFDIGFSELLIIAVLTLIVMGPERLPETVRTITLWFGRLRQFLSAARTEIEDEVGVDEIRRQLHNEQLMRDLDKARQEVVDIDININPNSILSDDLKND